MLNKPKIIPGDHVYAPNHGVDTYLVQDGKHNFTTVPELFIEIDGKQIHFNDEGMRKDKTGKVIPSIVCVVYPATQSYKDSIESVYDIELAHPKPRQPSHSIDVRQALCQGKKPLCWVSEYPIKPDEIENRSYPISFIEAQDEQGVFFGTSGCAWTYAELVKPEEVFSSEDINITDAKDGVAS